MIAAISAAVESEFGALGWHPEELALLFDIPVVCADREHNRVGYVGGVFYLDLAEPLEARYQLARACAWVAVRRYGDLRQLQGDDLHKLAGHLCAFEPRRRVHSGDDFFRLRA